MVQGNFDKNKVNHSIQRFCTETVINRTKTWIEKLKDDIYNNLRASKLTNIYHKSNVFNVAYQQRIRIVIIFNSKLNESAEWNKREEGISK